MTNKIAVLTLIALCAGAAFTLPACTKTNAEASSADTPPDENRFTKVVLDANLNEPMELTVLDDGRVLFVERRGAVKIYDPARSGSEVIARFEVFAELEEGLLGVALDPGYATNRWVYFAYSAPDEPEIRVARFVLEGSTLDFNSEKILLEIPVQREQCCHVAGSLEFDAQGNLYISIGDNTNPFASDGFAPIDEQPDRSPWDARKSSANTDDLRGKILRITPQPEGTYTIPDGNLFPKEGSGGRPEIYVMGNRNPFRLSIDARTGYLYWGEVGPDAGEDGAGRGPKGHDEVNQARQAGNFGWPLFVGNNKAYHAYEFATKTPGDPFDPAAPLNDSPNNTGVRTLPPAQPAFIWYPYGPSEEFPLVGEGGRNAMAGPVFYHEDYAHGEDTFPAYYDGKLFIYDWMRGWVMAVTMDDNGDFVRMEPFMPSTTFNNPMDMLFAPDGVMYVLEYGTGWFSQNVDARLSRIEYTAGNRPPTARVEADRTIGAAPLTVAFAATSSEDPDGDDLTYAWTFGGEAARAEDARLTYTFTEPGVYKALLTVTDAAGVSATDELDILVGNDAPAVSINITGNRTFFWDNASLDYRVSVTDTEDGSLENGSLAPEQVALTFDYLAQGADLTIPAQGHQAAMEAASSIVGKALIDQSDCQACHKADDASIGPSYTAVGEKYKDDAEAVARLAEKVIQGGGGVWGDQAMAAHPQLSQEEAERMIQYILSVGGGGQAGTPMPLQGVYTPREHIGTGEQGRYIIAASYTDRGGAGIGPLTGRDVVTLRHPRLQAETFDASDNATTVTAPEDTPGIDQPTDVALGSHGGHIAFDRIDLTGVTKLSAHIGLQPGATLGGRVEVRLGSPEGASIGAFEVPQSPETAGFRVYETMITPTEGVHALVFVFVHETQPDASDPVCALDWVYFHTEAE